MRPFLKTLAAVAAQLHRRQSIIPLALLAAGFLHAQTPDCPPVSFNFPGNGATQVVAGGTGDNRTTACTTWTVVYEATGISGYTLAFQSSVGALTPTSFGAYTGNTTNSSPSFGTAALGLATYSGLATSTTGGSTVNTPWIRVSVTGASGTGSIRGVYYGYKTGSGSGAGGGGGGTGCPNPCPVTQDTIPWLVAQSGLGTFSSAQQAVTASAVNLGTNTAKSVCVQAFSTNTSTVYVGPTGVTTSTGFPLIAGQTICPPVSNTNLIFVVAADTSEVVGVTWVN